MKVHFLFDRKEWTETLNRLSPQAKLYWRENYKFVPTAGWCYSPIEVEGKVLGKGFLSFQPEIEPKKGKSPDQPTRQLKKELEDAIAFTMMDRGWLPREDVRVNSRKVAAPAPRSSSQARGYIYLIRNGDLYKIGITTDLKRRLSELQPDEVVNVVKCSDYEKTEKEIHRRFRHLRIPQTEYFRLTESQLAEVEAQMERR